MLILSPDSLITVNGVHYPILEKGKGFYVCNRIYFRPEAEVVHHDLLKYNKAWGAFKVVPEVYNMVGAPLQETYTGDFFVYKKSGDDETLQQDYKNPLKGDVLMGNLSTETSPET